MHELKYRKIKIIDSSNLNMSYAKSVMNQKIREAEKDGWHKFGNITSIYDEKTDLYLLIQVMII